MGVWGAQSKVSSVNSNLPAWPLKKKKSEQQEEQIKLCKTHIVEKVQSLHVKLEKLKDQ